MSGSMLLVVVLLSYGTVSHVPHKIAGAAVSEQSCDELRQRDPAFEPLAKACDYAAASPHALPDFVCTEIVERYFSPRQKPEIITAQLTVEKMRSHYSAVEVNGKSLMTRRTGDDIFEEKAGSTGEFAMLFNVFNPPSHAEFAAPVDATVNSRKLKRYDFLVRRENNLNWTWRFLGNAVNPGYHGSVCVDGTGKITRLVIEVKPDEVDAQTPISEATTTIEYGDVAIAAGTHHVPIRAEAVSCFRFMEGCIRAQISFRDFHKFGADTRILPVPE